MASESTPFGIPAGARRNQLPHGLVVKTGGRKKGKDGKHIPVAYDHIKIGTMHYSRDERLEEHPLTKGRLLKELFIVLPTNNIQDFYQDWLEARAKRVVFCSNKRGGDTATRLQKDGTYKPVHCDPQTCPFFRNAHAESKANAAAEVRRLSDEYAYAGVAHDTQCDMHSYFLFHICNPDTPDEYLTSTGLLARYYTSSKHGTDNISLALADIYKTYGGQMQGLKIRLYMAGTTNPFGNEAKVLKIDAPIGKQMLTALADMGRRRKFDGTDFAAAAAALAEMTPEQIAALELDYLAEEFGRPSLPALEAPKHPAMTAAEFSEVIVDDQPAAEAAPEVEPEPQAVTSGDTVIDGLLDLLRLSAGKREKLIQQSGGDMDMLRKYLVDNCDKHGIDYSQLIPAVPSDEIPDAEYVEVDETAITSETREPDHPTTQSGSPIHRHHHEAELLPGVPPLFPDGD